MSKGLEALERLMANYYEMCQDSGNNDDQYQRCNLTSERAIIEKALKDYEETKKELAQIMKDYQDLGQYVYKVKQALKNNLKCNIIFGSNDEEWYLFVESKGKRIEVANGNDKEQCDLLKEVLL